jgi:hypothetical protein
MPDGDFRPNLSQQQRDARDAASNTEHGHNRLPAIKEEIHNHYRNYKKNAIATV